MQIKQTSLTGNHCFSDLAHMTLYYSLFTPTSSLVIVVLVAVVIVRCLIAIFEKKRYIQMIHKGEK